MLANEAIVMHEATELPLSPQAILVRDALVAAGLETPMVKNKLSNEEKRARIQASMQEIMQTLGLDLTDDSLQDTPRRIAKMYVNEIFSGLDYRAFPKITQIENKCRLKSPCK
jgi:GTP cyclohydrolase I